MFEAVLIGSGDVLLGLVTLGPSDVLSVCDGLVLPDVFDLLEGTVFDGGIAGVFFFPKDSPNKSDSKLSRSY